MKDKEIIVAYTRDPYYWSPGEEVTWASKHWIMNDVDISYILFVVGEGIDFQVANSNTYYYMKPTPELLDYICNGDFFGPNANAKLWYCSFKYALENEDCRPFWDKYKDTAGASQFMAIMLSSKNSS